jgi:hypothetical protein
MEQAIVLENLDEPSTAWLEQEAERLGLPIEQVIARLIRQAIENAELEAHHDLDDLASTWTDQEAQEILDTVAEMDLPIITQWSKELSIRPSELRQALMLGLGELRRQQAEQDLSERIVQALLDTGLAEHLTEPLPEGIEPRAERQEPPTLPGPLASEIIIAQRRGEL